MSQYAYRNSDVGMLLPLSMSSVNVLCHILSFLLTHNTAVENLISTALLIRVPIVVDSETVLVVVIGLTSPAEVDVVILIC